VSATDKAKDKAQPATGKVKKGAGKAIDDPYLEGEGKADQVKGNLKQAGEKVKDAFKNGVAVLQDKDQQQQQHDGKACHRESTPRWS
jgi:uncharacterized protein YjbJ (UPF0337 family)